jgi:TolB-like protein
LAEVFVSYVREDRAIAEKIANGLSNAGLSVWWDRHIQAGVKFNAEIDRQIAAARAVIVLWSAASRDSDWVHDEAEVARNANKLIPIRIDSTLPPLGFRQVQSLDFSGWNGNPKADSFTALIESARQFVDRSIGTSSAISPIVTPTRGRWGSPRTRLLSAAAVGLVVIATAVVALRFDLGSISPTANTANERAAKVTSPTTARFAILPFDALSDDPATRYFADGLADQIATTLNRSHLEVESHDDALALRGPERDALIDRLGVAMLLNGSVRKDGDAIKILTHIEDPVRHAIVYSNAFAGSAAHSDDLQARVATAIVRVIDCLNRALRSDNGLHDPALLARYLSACDMNANQIMTQVDNGPTEILGMLANLRAVTVGAPNFVPALTDLAQWEAQYADAFPDQREAMRKEAADAAQRALAIDPRAGDAYVTQSLLLPRAHFDEREKLLRAGIAADPSWPNPYGYLAEMLAQVGRTQEAVVAEQIAATSDLQIEWADEAVFYQARYGGPIAPCINYFTHWMVVAPGNQASVTLLECHLFAGQLDEAVKIVQSEAAPYAGTPLGDAIATQVVAMKTRSDADGRKAASAARALAATTNLRWVAVQNLAYMGDIDGAFALADAWQSPAAIDTQDIAFLFSRSTDSMRRDPRFMKLAARIGLVDYWQSTGHWPDFCADPKLPLQPNRYPTQVPTQPSFDVADPVSGLAHG